MENRIVRTSVGSFFQMALLNLSSIITTIVLARVLSLEQFGIYSLVNAVVFAITIVFSLGIPSSTARFIALSSDQQYRRVVVGRALSVLLPWLIICTGAYFLFYSFVAKHFFPDLSSSSLMWIIFALAIIELARLLVDKLSHGLSRMSIAVELSAYSSVLLVLMLIGAGLFYEGAAAVLFAKVLALLLPLPLAFRNLLRVFNQSHVGKDQMPPGVFDIAWYGLPLLIISLAAFCFLQADLLLLGRFLDLSAVGLYSICAFVYVRLTIFPRAVGNGLAPYMANAQDSGAWTDKFGDGMCYAMSFVLPITIFCAIDGAFLLKIFFGEKYVAVAPVFRLLSLYFFMSSFLAVINPILDFSGKAFSRALAVVLGAALNIALDILWIPVFGLHGAAYATLAGYALFFSIVVSTLNKSAINGLLINKKVWNLIVINIFLSIALFLFRAFFPSSFSIVLYTVLPLLYLALLLTFNIYNLKEISGKLLH